MQVENLFVRYDYFNPFLMQMVLINHVSFLFYPKAVNLPHCFLFQDTDNCTNDVEMS